MDECYGMIAVVWMLQHACCCRVLPALRQSFMSWRCSGRGDDNVMSTYSHACLWCLCGEPERFIYCLLAKESWSKTDLNTLRKTIHCMHIIFSIQWPEVQDNWLASNDNLHSMEVNWYEQKMYFRLFLHYSKCKKLSVKFIICCTTIVFSKLCLSPLG